MNAGKPTRFDRFERLVRGMLALALLALLAGVAWAMTDGGAMPAFDFGALRG